MSKNKLRIAVAQTDCVLADIAANLATVERLAADARRQKAEIVIFPELVLSGYEVGERYADATLTRGCEEVRTLQKLSREVGLILGFIEETEDVEFFNSAVFMHRGEIRHVHRKVYLPNYRTFDELRHFGAGRSVAAFDTPWGRMAILICGDAWHLSLPYLAAKDGADILFVLAASSTSALTPSIDVRESWERLNRNYALTLTQFVVFSNRVGVESMSEGGHELHFWGGSHICAPDGSIAAQAGIGKEDLLVYDVDLKMLRHHRQILPFRRDDRLQLTMEIGRRVLRDKSTRRDGFLGLVARRASAEQHGDELPPPADAAPTDSQQL